MGKRIRRRKNRKKKRYLRPLVQRALQDFIAGKLAEGTWEVKDDPKGTKKLIEVLDKEKL